MKQSNAPELAKSKNFSLPFHIPPELRAEFADRVARENAVRIVYAFIVGALAHFGSSWIDFQRWETGLFEQNSTYRWIFLGNLAWWLMVWVPIRFLWNWSRIRSGAYPVGSLRLWGNVVIVWAWAFSLFKAALSFQLNPALGFFAVVLINISLFIVAPKPRFLMLFVSVFVMSAVVLMQPDSPFLKTQFWLISICSLSMLVFLLSSVWYNSMARQFLTEKSLDAQKIQLTEQAQLLAAQNQIIKNDKNLLAEQLGSSHRQLNAFALRLAKKANFLDDVKTDLSAINAANVEDSKKRLLRKIDHESAAENDWAQFREQFEQVHPHFFKAILAQFPSLSAGELRLLSLLKMNLDSKEIADILGISTQSLNTARYRLRKNLGLAGDENLGEFVHRFS